MSHRYLITGGAGFIGSNLIRHLLSIDDGAEVTNYDLLTYAGVKRRLRNSTNSPVIDSSRVISVNRTRSTK